MANRDALIRYLIKNVQREALPLHVEVFAQQLLADPNFVVAAEGFTVDAITDELVSAAFPMATYDAVLVPFVKKGVQLAVADLEQQGLPAWQAYAIVGGALLLFVALLRWSNDS